MQYSVHMACLVTFYIETSILEAFRADVAAWLQISPTGFKVDSKRYLRNANATLILPAERKNARYECQRWAGIA